MKKNVSLLPEKNNNFFLYLFNPFFLFCFRQKKTSATALSLFVSCFFFFWFPSDDNWWQVGRWYGIPNLVMTWWLRWVVVTKLSKCSWRHIEMVPLEKGHCFCFFLTWNLFGEWNPKRAPDSRIAIQKLSKFDWKQIFFEFLKFFKFLSKFYFSRKIFASGCTFYVIYKNIFLMFQKYQDKEKFILIEKLRFSHFGGAQKT